MKHTAKGRILSLLMAFVLMFSLLPMSALAADSEQEADAATAAAEPVTFTAYTDEEERSDITLTENGYSYTDYNGNEVIADLYTIKVPADTVTVDFCYSANVLAYNYDADGNYISENNNWYDDYMTGADTSTQYVDADSNGEPDYIFVQTPYDSDYNSTLLFVITFAYATIQPVPQTVSFEASVNGENITDIEQAEDGYVYTDYSGDEVAVDLYTVTVPADTVTVDFSYYRNVLAYNYDADGNYISENNNWYDDYMTGADTSTQYVDADSNGEPDYIYVQTPYDSDYNSDLLFVITFAYAAQEQEEPVNASFAASVNGEALTDIALTKDGYSYTDYNGNEVIADLYTIAVPDDTVTVDFSYSENVLAYNYDADGNYISENNNWYDDYMTGADTSTQYVDADSNGVADFIFVQTPYDSDYNSTLLYVITFDYNGASGEDTPIVVDAAFEDIFRTTGDYVYNNLASAEYGNEWYILGLSRADYAVSDHFYSDYLDSVAQEMMDTDGNLSRTTYTTYSRTIIGVTAAGGDANDYDLPAYLGNLSNVTKQGTNGAIYALIALDTADYEIPANNCTNPTTRDALIETILNAQLSDGGWSYSGDTADVDLTAMAIQALAPYYGQRSDVTAAVNSALTCLSDLQLEDGNFESYGQSNACSAAQVVVALTALGIDPDNDSRFVKNGVSALDALLSFYVSGGGFWYSEAGTVDSYTTAQAYYALAAYYRYVNGMTSLYDMSDLADSGSSGGSASSDEDDAGGGVDEMLYSIISGADQTWTKGSKDSVLIICDGEIDRFLGIRLNDEMVDDSDYTVVSGSTEVTFGPDYLNTLSAGTYEVTFVYEDGSATTTLTVAEASAAGTTDSSTPTTVTANGVKTGETAPVMAVVILMLAAAAAAVCLILTGRRKRTR